MTLSNKVFTLAAASLLTIAAYAQAPSSGSRELMTMAELDSVLSRDISLSSGNYALYDSRPLLRATSQCISAPLCAMGPDIASETAIIPA